MEGTALVWAIGLDAIALISGRLLSGCWNGNGLTAALIVHFQWKMLESSGVTERPWVGGNARDYQTE